MIALRKSLLLKKKWTHFAPFRLFNFKWWFYCTISTPTAWTPNIVPSLVVFSCGDQLIKFVEWRGNSNILPLFISCIDFHHVWQIFHHRITLSLSLTYTHTSTRHTHTNHFLFLSLYLMPKVITLHAIFFALHLTRQIGSRLCVCRRSSNIPKVEEEKKSTA